MSTTDPRWEAKRTHETRMIEDRLKEHFERADAYRYNSASIRVRVIDSKFAAMSRAQRDGQIEPYLDQLPLETQRDIVALFTFAPAELERTPATFKEFIYNKEFDDPSPSML